MTCESRMHLRSDFQLLSAIDSGDIAAMASALKDGGGSPGSAALKLLLAIVARREKDALVLMPTRTRGHCHDPLASLSVRPLWLRAGLPPEVRISLISLLEGNRVWVGIRRLNKRGPRSDRVRISKQVLDGAEITSEIHDLAFRAASKEANKKPVGSVVPVVIRRGMKAQAIAQFVSRSRGQADVRYAMKALKALRDFDEKLKS